MIKMESYLSILQGQNLSWLLSLLLCSAAMLYYALGQDGERETSVQDDLLHLGTDRAAPRLKKAVVCGGGIAGLQAAKICCYHFDEVVVIDPEFSKVMNSKSKARVIQYNSTHVFLVLFAQGLRRLWPAFDNKVREAGDLLMNADLFLHFDGVYAPVPTQGYPETFSLRRHLLEPILHQLLAADPQAKKRLQVIDGQVKHLKCSSDGGRIESVHGSTVGGGAFDIDAVDLVIDCTGGFQCGPKWLEEVGLPPLDRSQFKPNLDSMTITFTVSDELGEMLPIPGGYRAAGWIYSFFPAPGTADTTYYIGKTDNRTIQLYCGSWGHSNFPKEAGDIVPIISAVSKKATEPAPEWLVEVLRLLAESGQPTFRSAKATYCFYTQYCSATDLPNNFIANGDALMQLDPVFGQGCGKSMAGTLVLDRLLRECNQGVIIPSFSKKYFKRLDKRIRGSWDSCKALGTCHNCQAHSQGGLDIWILTAHLTDYGFPTTQPLPGETLRVGASLRWMMGVSNDAALVDEQIALAKWKVQQLLATDEVITAPSMLFRLCRASLIRKVRKLMGMKEGPRVVQICHK